MRSLLAALLLLPLARAAGAAPVFTRETGTVRLTSATIQAAVNAFPARRYYYIRGSSLVYSASSADGVTLTEEAGVRLSSLTVPSVDIAISSITGLSVLQLSGGGYRMLYSVIGTTNAYRIYSATSADGLAWANDTGTAIAVAGSSVAYPSLVKLTSGDWRAYYVQGGQLYTALSTNEGRNWAAGALAFAPSVTPGQVSATKLTNNDVRLYYSAPLPSGTSDVLVLSALSSDANGTSFSADTGIRFSTSPGSLSYPFVDSTTDTFRWRLYYDYAPPNVSTGDAYSATADAPAPAKVTPSRVVNSLTGSQSTITGDVFSPGVTALLRMSGQADITGAGLTRTDDQTVTATFNTFGATTGLWDLVMTNSNGVTATLSQAVFVDFPGGAVQTTDNLIRPRNGQQARIDITTYNTGHITAKLYTLDGRPVATLMDAYAAAGTTTLRWGGTTGSGAGVASGVYILHVKGPKLDDVSKIVVIK